MSRRPSLRGWRAACAAGLTLALSSCGYKSGFVLPEGQSIGVQVFANESKLRDIEMRLHPYLTDSVQRMVGADLVGPDRASLWIEGAVLDYSRRSGIRSPDNVLLETGVQIVVVARLMRRLSHHPEGLLSEVVRQVTVVDERGYLIGEALAENDAVSNALRNIADRVVLDLFADLAYEDAPVADLGGRTP